MDAAASLWREAAPLLLASTSKTRKLLIESAGLPVETEAPDIDERAMQSSAPAQDASTIARLLAGEKAAAVSRRHPRRIVLGADQTLVCDGALFHKPAHRAAAAKQLSALSGRTHVLNSAIAIAHNGEIVHASQQVARMTMRALGPEDIRRYLDLAGDAALRSVGAYQVEGLGIHLFDGIDGDHATILGLPLLPLLAALRDMKLLAF